MPMEAEKTYPDVRPLRAFTLGMVLGVFVGIIGTSAFIICDSCVFLPSTIEKRYKVKALGCISFTESKNNICYATKGATKLAIVGLGDLENPMAVEALEFIKNNLEESCQIRLMSIGLLSEEFNYNALRECDRVLLLLRAGAQNGKVIERAVEQMRRQDVEITGAFLFGEDKKLIKQYYR